MHEPWRRRCPEGHTSWRCHGPDYYCTQCERYFETLVDAKTGREVRREGIQ